MPGRLQRNYILKTGGFQNVFANPSMQLSGAEIKNTKRYFHIQQERLLGNVQRESYPAMKN